MDNREQVNVLIKSGYVIAADPQRRVIEDGAVAVKGERIVAVGKMAELAARYRADREIDARREAVLPGLIDAHAHAGQQMKLSRLRAENKRLQMELEIAKKAAYLTKDLLCPE
jgi:5-methylthioadenosine/S-adenosylhomocysteine deaminase